MEKKLTKREKLLEKKTLQALELQKINEEIKLEIDKERKRTLGKISNFIKKIELLDALTIDENLFVFLGGIYKAGEIIKNSHENKKEFSELTVLFEDFETQFKNRKTEEKVIKNEE